LNQVNLRTLQTSVIAWQEIRTEFQAIIAEWEDESTGGGDRTLNQLEIELMSHDGYVSSHLSDRAASHGHNSLVGFDSDGIRIGTGNGATDIRKIRMEIFR